MACNPPGSSPSRPGAAGARHRVVLELEVDDRLEEIGPEDWELQDLALALLRGSARAQRTVRGLVIDPEDDRLSVMLRVAADGIDEAVQLHWIALAEPWPVASLPPRSPRPPLETLAGLDELVGLARYLARRLDELGL